MKIVRVGQKIYTTAKKVATNALEPKRARVTGLLPNAWKKSHTTGLTTTQLIELITRGLF